ncbi:ATP-binding cassette domain-containing protein [Haematomicrobium sanguinis]|uniref:ATP-binding cassette domain-containing protein n=1 Tax=Haematomicrobium sanguinis TaxID=479106 RepID=UPI00068FE5F3|nr:ABC transporter ATP-binding protein [Haematomicrobium sanguinis]
MKTLRNLWFLGKISWKANPWATILAIISLPVSLLGSLQSVAVGMLVAGALSVNVTLMVVSGAILVFSMCAGPVLELLRAEAMTKQRERLALEFDERVGKLYGSLPTINHLVDKELLDKVENLRTNQSALGQAWISVIGGLQSIVTVVGVLVVAFSIDWRLSLIALASTINLVGPIFFKRWDDKADKLSAPAGRATRHLMDLSTDVRHGAELRVFDMRPDIMRRLFRHSRERAIPRYHAQLKRGAFATIEAIIIGVVAIWVLYSMGQDVIGGKLGVPQMAAALALLTQLTWLAGQAGWMIAFFVRSLQIVNFYMVLEDYAEDVRSAHSGTRAAPSTLQTGIDLRGVNFTYPGADSPTLKDVNLSLPAGAVVAVVGENGSGKTTLVNTVVGLYNRDADDVFIDGVPASEFNVESLREAMTGSFQDHARLEFAAKDEIGSGHLQTRENLVAVGTAADRAGATTVLESLPSGAETQLGTQWPNGQDLSGGQWQRLSLARGFMRTTPLVTILDEPTSALDASAEHDLFDRYIRAANDSRARGGITILVTHRFSTVRQADLVVVMRGGEVFEVGTHAELMAKNGYYAEMYELQAGGYR